MNTSVKTSRRHYKVSLWKLIIMLYFQIFVFTATLPGAEKIPHSINSSAPKIRAAYWGIKTVEQGRRQLQILNTHGFNTALVKDGSFQLNLALWQAWGNVAGTNNIQLFPVLNFAGPPEIKKLTGEYSPYVDRNGRSFHNTPCPLDENYWEASIENRFVQLASLSKDLSIAGVLFDMEMYGSDISVYHDFCFCDACWKSFFQQRRQKTPKIPMEQRFSYLTRHEMFASYTTSQEKRLRSILTHIEQHIHAIAPSLSLGFLTYQDNWFYKGLIQGLGTAVSPVLVFSENSYIVGYTPYILRENEAITKLQPKRNTPTIFRHIPGLWLGRFFPEDLPSHLYHLAIHTQGYWLFTADSLWSEAHKDGPYALHGTAEEYWQAFRKTNTHVDSFDRNPTSYRSSLPTIYRSSFYDRTQGLLFTPPSLQQFIKKASSEKEFVVTPQAPSPTQYKSYRDTTLFHCVKSVSPSDSTTLSITHVPVGKPQTNSFYTVFNSEGHPFIEGALDARNSSVDLEIPSNISRVVSVLIEAGVNISRMSARGMSCMLEASRTFPLSINNTIQRYRFYGKPGQRGIKFSSYSQPGEGASLSFQSPNKDFIDRYTIIDRVEISIAIPELFQIGSTDNSSQKVSLQESSRFWEVGISPIPSEVFDDVQIYFYNHEFPYLMIPHELSVPRQP